MYHTVVFSLSGYGRVSWVTRRRFSQTSETLVVALATVLHCGYYQRSRRSSNRWGLFIRQKKTP